MKRSGIKEVVKMNQKISLVLLLLAVVALAGVPQASAVSTYKTWFETNYSFALNSRIDACLLCHVNPDPNNQGTARNPYGTDFGNNGHSFTAIETFNSDGDGFINIDEIHNLTFPGNSSDFPPVITSFTPPSPVTDVVGAPRTFTVTVNQPLNVIWLINGAQVQNTATTGANNQSTYTNTSAVQGTWNVSAIAQKTGDGTAMQTWTWNVGAAPTPAGTFNISGLKINGTNNNGMGIENWNIMLLNATTGTPITSTMTNSTGFYNFTGLTNGTYNVTEGMKAGWTNTSTSPMSQIVTINGADMTKVNFTNMLVPPTPTGTFNISGFKVNDTNANNIWEPGEMGIDKWNIMLLNATTGAQIASTLTDAQGFYEFMNLAPGIYNVTEEMKAGFTPSGATFKVVTIENMDVKDVDFLNHVTVPPAVKNTISGFKINDLNGNGKQDAGENGLPDWNIQLIGIVPETAGINKQTTTDDKGFYSFEDLPAGMYLVVETVKGGYVPSGPPVLVVTLENGTNSMNNNFMNRPISSLIPDLSGLLK